jgi:hypothetical protein
MESSEKQNLMKANVFLQTWTTGSMTSAACLVAAMWGLAVLVTLTRWLG